MDVVLGAMAGMLFFQKLLQIQLFWQAYGLLALAVWSIYTLDHLLDVREDSPHFSSRRKFHFRHRKMLMLFLGLAVLIGLVGAFWWFGWGKELQLTLILALMILGSNLMIRKIGTGWLKELSIAVFYVVGIFWLPVLRASEMDVSWIDLLFLPAYILLAFLNLLMLSQLDQLEDESAGYFSATRTLTPALLLTIIRKIAFALIFLSMAGFILLPSFYRPFSCILLVMALVHYLVFFNPNLDFEEKRKRMEAVFLLPWLLVFL